MVTRWAGLRIGLQGVPIDFCGVSGMTMGRITDLRNPLCLDIAVMADATDQAAQPSLHICPDCSSNLVQPTSWEQVGDRSRWRIWRRCPECEWAGQGVHSTHAVDAYDELLDLGAHEVANELRALEHANMAELAEAFTIALQRNLICADDFRR